MPQPIDVQTELARVTTMERVQQISDRLSLAAHQRTSDQAEKQQVAAETQAQQTEQKSEQVERDLRRHTPYGRRRQHGGDRQDPEDPTKPALMPPAAHEEHQLDISI
jgi:hypothetical protein